MVPLTYESSWKGTLSICRKDHPGWPKLAGQVLLALGQLARILKIELYVQQKDLC